jgi:hypothetical protein
MFLIIFGYVLIIIFEKKMLRFIMIILPPERCMSAFAQNLEIPEM